jgi:hypothetical protein
MIVEKRLNRLDIVYRRAEPSERAFRDEPIDWRQVLAALPACFAALTADEPTEWGALMAEFHAPGAWQGQKPRGYYARLAELDNKVDWHAGQPPLWPVH